jgi:polyphenol oxidase
MTADFLSPLCAIPGLRVDFIPRVPDLPLAVDRDEAMRRLRPLHTAAVEKLGFAPSQWWRAEQVHGTEIAIAGESPTILAPDGLPVAPGADGLIGNKPGHLLAIYVADCGAIWLADRNSHAIALLHSGKKGTEGNILGRAVALMRKHFGTDPQNLIGVLGPCIRPPHYEVDFAAEIIRQAEDAGVGTFHDCQLCTASNLPHYYSYRKELGHTGRMMALIGYPTDP